MEEIKKEKMWLTVFEENYPFMRSLIERTVGELRYKDFVDCMDLVVDLTVSKERERITNVVSLYPGELLVIPRQDIFNLINTK